MINKVIGYVAEEVALVHCTKKVVNVTTKCSEGHY